MAAPRGDYTAGRPGSDSERSTSGLIQLGAIVFGFLSPLTGFILLREQSAFLRQSLRSALNFQLTVLLAYLVVLVVSVIALASTALVPPTAGYYEGLTIVLAGLLVIATAVGVANAVACIVGAVRANRGQVFRYPLAIHFVR